MNLLLKRLFSAYLFLIISLNNLQAQDHSPQVIHENQWNKAARNSGYDNYYKYSIYSSRSIMVKHPEIYLQADSVWMEALVTVYGGWQNEYNVRDRNDANYWNDAAGLIDNSISHGSKYPGNEFKWMNCNWTKHRENLVKMKNLYESGSPFYTWLDLRLPLMWNALKGIGWKTSFLSASEGLYFQKRSEGKNTYLMITDEETGYAVTVENGLLKLFDGATGLEITKTQLVGKPVLVMNQKYVWYPLMDRDDRITDASLSTIISQYCSMNSKPQLSTFENAILDDLKSGTLLKDDNDKSWALLAASRFGKQNGWRSSVVRELTRNIFPLRYQENMNNPSDIPYELTAMNMTITEMGNRLSPASAIMAAEAWKYSSVSLTEAVKAVGNKYYQWFNRAACPKDQEFVYGDYYKMWLPTLDDKAIAGIGDCFVEACAVGSALVIADVPGWNVWITNWWDSKNGGGHVIAGVYYNGEGKTLSNGLYNKNDGQSTNGPLWSYNSRLIFPLVYKPDYGFLASGQVSPYSKFDLPFTNLDQLSVVDFVSEIASDEPELFFANGLDAQANSLKISALDYLAFIKTSSKKWMTWNMGGLIPAGTISGKVIVQNNQAAGDVLVKLIDLNKKTVRSAGTTDNGDYKIESIPEGDYKIYFAGKYSNTVLPLVDNWYNNKNSFDAADLLHLSVGSNLSDINTQMSLDTKPSVKITSPLNGSKISGSVVVNVNASDDYGIKKAGFYLNNKPLSEVYTAPYSYVLNTEKLANGSYIIIAKVYDTIGQVNSDSITVTVFNDLPPVVRISSPENGSILNGSIIIAADASDDAPLKKVTLFVDGNKINELTAEPYQFSFDLTGLASGGHTVKISAEDAGGHAASDEIIIYKNNPAKEEFSFYKIIGGSPAGGKFNYPQGIAADDEGNLYVADRGNNRVQKFGYDGTFISQWDGNKVPGIPLIEPYGITVARNKFIFVANSGTIFKFTKEGEFISQWGYTGTADGLFLGSHAIAADSSGNVYITDRDANRIQKFDINGNFILKWGQKGTADGEFNDPRGICVDENNFIYVVDIFNKRIQKFSDDGKFLGKWAFPGNVYTGWPRFWGIASDRKGHIYFSSTDNQYVIKYNTDGSIASQWDNQTGDGAGEFLYPQGITIGKYGHVYLTDDNARVQEFSQSGTFVSQWGSLSSMDKGEFCLPLGMAQDKTGDIYVADYYNNRIQKLTADGRFKTQWGKLGRGDGDFIMPVGIAIDDEGFVYVSELGGRSQPFNARIQKFSPDGDFIKKWGSEGSGDGQFNWPYGMCFDKEGYLNIVDFGNCRIQKFTRNGDFVSKWGVKGLNMGELYYPSSIAFDKFNNCYISQQGDGSNPGRIQKFSSDGKYLSGWSLNDPNSGRGAPYFYGLSFDKFGFLYAAVSSTNSIRKYRTDGTLVSEWGKYGRVDAGNFQGPGMVLASDNGKIYITDTWNNRLQIFNNPQIPTTKENASEKEIPESFNLMQNYPNPFNPLTKISYSIPVSGNVKLSVINILGKEVSTLVNEYKSAGNYTVPFNASSLPSGVYIYTIQAGQFRDSKKLLLLK